MAVNANWQRYCTLTVANGKVSGSVNLTNFPALLTENDLPSEILNSSDSNRPKSDGGDIRFTSDAAGTTELAFEIVSFTQSSPSGTCEIWVKIPTLQYNVDTTIYMWWKNASANAYATTDTYGRNAVWSDYEFVSHDGGVTDSTGNYTPTVSGAPAASTNHLGHSNLARYFDTTTEHYEFALSSAFDLGTTDCTITFWANKDNVASLNGRAIQINTLSPAESIQMIANSSEGANWVAFAGSTATSGAYQTASNSAWHYVRGEFSGGATPSHDGVRVDGGTLGTTGTASTWGLGTAADEVWIGARNDANSAAEYEGYLSEIRIEFATTPSADEYITEYNNQLDDGTFWTDGTPQNNVTQKAVSDSITLAITESSSVPQMWITSIDTNPFDDKETGIIISGAGFGASQGTGKVELVNNAVYASGTKTAQTVTAWSDTSITITGVLPAAGPGTYWLFVTTNASAEQDSLYPVVIRRELAFSLADSPNVANQLSITTSRLTPPAGSPSWKSGYFFDTAPNFSTYITMGYSVPAGSYTEYEWCFKALNASIEDAQYEFRVVDNSYDEQTASAELTTYTVIPKLTVLGVIQKAGTDTLSPYISSETTAHFLSSNRSDTVSLVLSDVSSFPTIQFTRSDSLLTRIDEAYTLLVSLARTDDIKPRLDEAFAILVSLARSDTLAPRIDDVGSLFKFVQIVASDFIRPRITESAAQILDILHIALWDFLQWDFVDVDYTYAQVESLREDNNVNALFRYPDQIDRYGVVIGDFDTFAANSFGFATTYATAADALVQVFGTDTLSPQVIEGAVDMVNMFIRADSINPKITESIINQLRSSRVDSLTLAVAEFTYNLLRMSRSDDILLAISETWAIILSLSAQDDLKVLVDELSVITAAFGVNDTLYTLLNDTLDIVSFLSRSDTLLPRVDDALNILSSLARSDLLNITINDISDLLARFAVSDDLLPYLTELAEILWLTLEGFRWRADDGSESTATWLKAQDTDLDRQKNLITRLRILLDTNSDAPALQLKLQYKPVGDPDWEWRDVE